MKAGNVISFNTNCNGDNKLLQGVVKYKDQLGLITFVDGVQYELKKLINIKVISNYEEIESLQNAANVVGLTVHENFTQDKRKTVKTYFAQRGVDTVSPVLDYKQLNHFLLGYIRCSKQQTNF